MARGMSSVTRAESLAISERIESSSLWNSDAQVGELRRDDVVVGGHPKRPVTYCSVR